MEKATEILAADLGGTKVLAGNVDALGRLNNRVWRQSEGGGRQESVLANLYAAIDEAMSGSKDRIAAIALAAAGAIDLESGVVTHSPNMMEVNGMPLRKLLSQRYGLPSIMLNDASAAALAEHRLGAGRGCRNMIYLTVSTGIGGGIIIDNRLYQGTDGMAGEFGHTTIDRNGPADTCGSFGCLEQYASGTAIARKAADLASRRPRSALTDVMDKHGKLTAADVAEAAGNGDALAVEVFSEAMRCLGIGVASVVNVFNPEIVVIGGGVSQAGEMVFDPVRRFVAEHTYKLAAASVQIVPAELGDAAGAVGAALFAREELKL